MDLSRFPFVVLTVLLGAAFLAGCGNSLAIDQDDVKDGLTSEGIEAESVDCPDDVENEEGNTFTCTVTIAGEDQDVEFELTGNDEYEVTGESAAQLLGLAPEGPEGDPDAAGETGTDEAIIEDLLTQTAADPSLLCDPEHSSEPFIETLGGTESCVEAVTKEGPDESFSVESIDVAGDGTATAVVSGDDPGTQTIGLVQDDEGGWFVDSVE